MDMLTDPVILSNVTDELALVGIACQKYGLVCTEQGEFNKFTYVVGFVGILIGIICLLGFQYTRRKTAEKIAAAEKAEAERLKKQDSE